MRNALILLGLCWLCAGAAASSPGPEAARLREVLVQARNETGAEAVLFGLWRGDRAVMVTALGNSMTTVPATPDMHYRIGGITETVMSTLLMMLAEHGRIDLDAPIAKWLPDLLAADRVTPRMLVANTAGYRDYVWDEGFGKLLLADPFRRFTADELIQVAVRDGRMQFPPGTSQAYSHTEYVILAQVLEKATGRSLGDLYQEQILGPYGLADTRVPATAEILPAPVLHAYLEDRKVYEDSTYHDPSWAGATGALTSNLRDLGRWARLFGTGALVSKESFQAMTAPTSVGQGRNRPDRYFAYGFAVVNGWFVQNPNMNGYSGGFAYHPPTGTTLVVAATKRPGCQTVSPAQAILDRLADLAVPEAPLDL